MTHLHHEVDDEAVRADQSAKLIAWLSDITWPLVVVGDFNAEPVEPTYRQMIDAGFRSAFAEANGAEPAVTWPSGIKAPGRTSMAIRVASTTSAARGGHGRGLPPRVRPARGWRPDALPVGPPRARGARPVRWPSPGPTSPPPPSRPARRERPRTLRLAHRGDWRAAPENSLAAMEAALRVAACTASSSMFGPPATVSRLDHDLRRVQGLRRLAILPDRRRVRGAGISLAEVLKRAGCDPYLDVELKEKVPAAIDLLELGGARRRRRPAGRSAGDAVVSSFDIEILRWLADERPTWPRWLNAIDLFHRDDRAGARPRVRGSLLRLAPDRRAGSGRATDAGLKVAAWTVRSNADYERLAGLGVVAICAEAEALDG